jgi:predicted nucleic acid-binding protein
VLISALLYPDSVPAKALYHAADNDELVLADQNISELRKITKEKFPNKQVEAETFLTELSYELILAPETPLASMSDSKDEPILNAAILADVDIIISGDKHFLSLDIERPKSMNSADYLNMSKQNDEND